MNWWQILIVGAVILMSLAVVFTSLATIGSHDRYDDYNDEM